ncbi:response regulator transcription factor [Xanthocytophaga agilis]|uniref:Response regulator transcription factor n=1 Tax=Xanthocytophaga agilis TaxID=3048010 RepID=A0AAE3R6P1_9BACT|nr:response regulator transcription factor [Xanthocytophaga agilis]MDJ1501788.1 response regulator transcription factor [Xanthocytophaga agilis]
MSKAHILLIEDDLNLGFVIKDNLEMEGFSVTLCDDGEKGWHVFTQLNFDICVLDVMLPRKDGFTLAQEIRQKNTQIPIIFLTAKSMKEDKITGFRIGADDYLTKPFSIEELTLRIEALLRRSKPSINQQNQYTLGKYVFDHPNLTLRYESQVQTLTQKEADVLLLLCKNAGKAIKREEILLQVWGSDDYFLGRSLDVFISRLRKHLNNDPAVEITNLHGVGFKLKTPSL